MERVSIQAKVRFDVEGETYRCKEYDISFEQQRLLCLHTLEADRLACRDGVGSSLACGVRKVELVAAELGIGDVRHLADRSAAWQKQKPSDIRGHWSSGWRSLGYRPSPAERQHALQR